MADLADLARDREEAERAAAITRTRQRLAEMRGRSGAALDADGATVCTRCGDDIEDARRRLLPGVHRCAECQAEIEKQGRA